MSTANDQIPLTSPENGGKTATALMRRLRVKYRYSPALAPGGREKDPIMHIFLSQNVKPENDLVKVFNFTQQDIENPTGLKIDGNEKLKEHFHGTPSVSTTADSTTTTTTNSISSKLKTKNTKKMKEELTNASEDAW